MAEELEKEVRFTDYNPSNEEKEYLTGVYERFRIMQGNRDRNYHFFNDRSLIDVIDDAQKRFNGYIEKRQGPDDWGAKTIDPLTRNKVIFILATLASQRVQVNFYNEDGDDVVRSRILKAMHEHSYIDENESIQTFYEMLSAIVKGTVVGYEGFKAPRRTMKIISGYDVETGKVTYTTKEVRLKSKVFSEIVPLEDFYPGDMSKRDLQDMNDVAWRTVKNHDLFMSEFSKYPNAKYVIEGGRAKEDTYYKDFVQQNLDDDSVEVIRYFNKLEDRFDIVANGVLLTEMGNPLVWNHKLKGLGFPFWSTIYEPYDEEFFYGKPLPEKLKSNQDVLDALFRMILDQTFLSIHKPVLTSAVEDIEDDLIKPGRRIAVADVNEWKELDISSPNAAQFQMFAIVKQSLEDSSASDTLTGRSGGGDKTATQVATEREGAQTLLSMFKTFIEWGAEKKARLRVENQLQFYPTPTDVKDGKLVYRTLRVDNVPLILTQSNGSIIIKFVKDKKELGDVNIPEEIRPMFEERYGKNFDGISVRKLRENVEEVRMTPDFLDDFAYGVKIVADSSVKMTDAMKKAMELEFVDRVMKVMPDLVNREKVSRDLMDVFNKNPDEYLNSSQSEQKAALQRTQEVNAAAGGGGNGVQEPGRTSDLVERLTGAGRMDQQTQGGMGQDRPGPMPGPTVTDMQQ